MTSFVIATVLIVIDTILAPSSLASSNSRSLVQREKCAKCGSLNSLSVPVNCSVCGFFPTKPSAQGELKVLETGYSTNWSPNWSLNGNRIAFTALDPSDNAYAIFYANVSGDHSSVRVSDKRVGSGALGPVWGTGEDEVAFAKPKSDGYGIEIVNGPNKPAIPLDIGKSLFTATFDWNKSSNSIAFDSGDVSSSSIFLMKMGSRVVEQVTTLPGTNFGPKLSPSGTKIAFTSSKDGNNEIYVIDSNGTNLKRLTNDSNCDQQPSWSPDGKQIVFESDRERTSVFKLYVMSADGNGKPIQITFGEGTDSNASWALDGRRIAYQSRRGTQDLICILTMKR